LGTPGNDYVSKFLWKYLSDERGYKLTELGYYYYDAGSASYVYVPFAQGTDIGKDGTSLTSGAGLTYLDIGGPFKLYAKFDTGSTTLTWHEQDALNADLLKHVNVVPGAPYDWNYNWDDQYGGGDRDFDDAVIGFSPSYITYTPGSYLSSNTDIFLTAHIGSITQAQGGNIYANNLMLSANTGITGTVAGDAIDTQVSHLSAINNTGDIRILNSGALTIDNLSLLTGINPGVIGSNGVTNGAGIVDITAASPLTVAADVNSGGDIILTAGESAGAGDDLTANANIISSAGNINLRAGDDILQNSGLIQAQTSGKTIALTAGYNDLDNLGAISQTNGANIIGTNLILSATTGIGSGNALETQVSNLQATNALSGNIEIANTGNLNLADLSSLGYAVKNFGSGDIDISVASDITLSSLVSGSALVKLTASGGAIIDNNLLNPDIIANDLILSAATGIGSGNALETQVTNLQATNVNNGIEISNTGALNLKYLGIGSGPAISNSNGWVNISTASPLNVIDEVLAFGNIGLYAGGGLTGDINVNNNVRSSGGYVELEADNDILVNSANISAATYIGLSAGNKITQTAGQIGSGAEAIYALANNDILLSNLLGSYSLIISWLGSINDYGTTSVTSNDLLLYAARGINLHTAVSRLSAANQTAGDITIANIGNLELAELGWWGFGVYNLASGIVHIVTDGNLTVDSVNAALGGVYLESTNGSIISGISSFGFNVIASGYSYFSAPNGTIGVGSLLNPFDNPLKVDIEVVAGAPSALPAGYILPATYGSTVPGLILGIGAKAYPSFAGGANGAIGLSGVIAGVVRPGGTAVTYVDPAPGIDIAEGSGPPGGPAYGPPGYVFYDDIFVTPPGFLQIWPAIPSPPIPDISTFMATPLNKYLRAYYEILKMHRVVFSLPFTPTLLYFYHPLSLMDFSAFDGIALDIGAYDFIDGNLNFKDPGILPAYYNIVK
jgi:hypothetical protein